MRALRALLAVLLAAGPARADQLAAYLNRVELAPVPVADPAASDAREGEGEPAGEGELDAADLSRLQARLSRIAQGYEIFASPFHLTRDSVRELVSFSAPQGLLRGVSASRVDTLDRVYRALALVDYTLALRYPEGEACARAERKALLRSPDGLFADPATGELAPWLKAELSREKAADVPARAVEASASTWTMARYQKTLTSVRSETRRLADPDVAGAERAALLCRRGLDYQDLSAAQRANIFGYPDVSRLQRSVVFVRSGADVRAGLVVEIRGRKLVLTAAPSEAAPVVRLATAPDADVPARVERRGEALALLSAALPEGVPALTLDGPEPRPDTVAFAVGHPRQGGPWSFTRGLLISVDDGVITTDAVIDEGDAGGPVIDDDGRLIGVAAATGRAWRLSRVRAWLDADAPLPAAAPLEHDLGSAALLTPAWVDRPGVALRAPAPVEAAFGGTFADFSYTPPDIPTPRGVCVSGCDMPRSRSSSSSGYSSSSDSSGPACVPPQCIPLILAPFVGLFKLFSGMFSRKETPAAPAAAGPGKLRHKSMYGGTEKAPPPDPAKPKCKFERLDTVKEIGPGERARLAARFSCDDPKVPLAGHKVRFTLGWSGTKVQGTYETATGPDGVASIDFVPELMAGDPAPIAPSGQQLTGLDLAAAPIEVFREIAPPTPAQVQMAKEAAGAIIVAGRGVAVRSVATIYLGAVASTVVVAGAIGVSFTVGYKGTQLVQKKFATTPPSKTPDEECAEAKARKEVLSQFIDETRLAPGFLDRHEGVDGAHTKARHIKDRTNPADLRYLKGRLEQIESSSAFFDQPTAEDAIREAVRQREGQIGAWIFASGGEKQEFSVPGDPSRPGGFGISDGDDDFSDRSGTHLRLLRVRVCHILIHSAWPD